jgi:hypothetical protein
MTFARRLEPEWLDQMAADDPRSIRVRHDLRRVNILMRNAGSMASALKRYAAGRQPRTIVDLGSGDGQFMLQVARRLASQWHDVRVILLDQRDIVSQATRNGFAALNWSVETVCSDVFDFLGDPRFSGVDIVTSNLFLHHLNDRQLALVFAKTAQLAWLMVACEPRRSKFVVRASRMLWTVGCSGAAVHDAVISARAGFTADDLAALWPARDTWELHESSPAFFTHRFVARRSA